MTEPKITFCRLTKNYHTFDNLSHANYLMKKAVIDGGLHSYLKSMILFCHLNLLHFSG